VTETEIVLSLPGGTGSGSPGLQNGTGTAASFRLGDEAGLAIDAARNLYVSDVGNREVRKISPQGVVITFLSGFNTDILDVFIYPAGILNTFLANGSVSRLNMADMTATQVDISVDYDFLLKVTVRDMKHYQDFVFNKLGSVNSIGSTHSTFVMAVVKNTFGAAAGK